MLKWLLFKIQKTQYFTILGLEVIFAGFRSLHFNLKAILGSWLTKWYCLEALILFRKKTVKERALLFQILANEHTTRLTEETLLQFDKKKWLSLFWTLHFQQLNSRVV